MSIYWRWVVVTAVVSILAAIPATAIETYVASSTGSDDPTRLTTASWVVLAVPVVLAEYWVLASRFPRLSLRLYVGLSLISVALVAIGLIWMVEGEAFAAGNASEAVPESAATEMSDAEGLKALGILLGITLLIPAMIYLPWIAIARVALGFLLWFMSILLGGAGSIGFDVTLAAARGLDWWATGGYHTWPEVAWTFTASAGSSLTYALISGIGVARLRPIPEGTS